MKSCVKCGRRFVSSYVQCNLCRHTEKQMEKQMSNVTDDQINAAIEALPVCKDGKQKVKELVSLITGKPLAREVVEGSLYKMINNRGIFSGYCIAVQIAPNTKRWVSLGGNRLSDNEGWPTALTSFSTTKLVYVAPSLEYAIRNKLIF